MSPLVPSIHSRDHIRGGVDAPVTLVMYGDFECPNCGTARELVGDLIAELGDQVRFVFRHFPLTDTRAHAAIAAEASEIAADHGCFWEYAAILFANQDALDPDDLIAYAESLGITPAEFVDAMESGRHRGRVQHDVASGHRSGVRSTPTFFVNGELYEGPLDLEALRAEMRAAALRRLVH